VIPKYKKILYATDLSANAAHAFGHVIGLARSYRSEVHILHVLPEMEPAMLNYISTVMGEDRLADLELEHKEEIKDKIRRRIHEFAKDQLSDRPEDVDRITEIEIHHGSPVGRILEVSDRIGADLIVIGSHGKGRLKYAFLGSVAEKLLRKSHRPVMVVPLKG
jgi:nucleotide-binding universal stress UspA family protein